jgi:hypothetical protein
MLLQNRVTPFGELTVTPARGMLMGNRGGRLHNARQELGNRRWASRQWICCRLAFKDRHRRVWGNSYSELFFLDEVTAFAAGHRPCFECRRKDAQDFAARFPGAHKAPAMDDALHRERLDGKVKRLHRRAIDALPDGAMMALDGEAYAVRGTDLLRWTASGYADRRARPGGIDVDVLTPPSILHVLEKGYAPQWHPSAAYGGSTGVVGAAGGTRRAHRK